MQIWFGSFVHCSPTDNSSVKSSIFPTGCFICPQIEENLKAAGKSHLFTRLSYPGAGHLIEPPYMPNSRASLWSAKPKKCEQGPSSTSDCSQSQFFLHCCLFYSDHSVGGASCPSCCCSGGFLEEDPAFYGV